MADPSPDEALAQQAERLRASGALGRSEVLLQLFDYLLTATLSGMRPKEVEIAMAVFGKPGAFDGGQDASVRVYMHRLRKKLDDYYDGPGRDQPVRLAIPKGEYRLALLTPEPSRAPGPRRMRTDAPWLPLALAALLLVNLAGWGLWTLAHRDPVAAARRAAPWAQVLQGGRPLILVVGDYYIFGDIDRARGVDRLVREYAINSRDDLDGYLMEHPDAASRYRDLDLFYLPVSVALALRDVLPVLEPRAARRDDLRVITASDLTPEMLRRNDIVYVGYLSGLGVLRDPVFAGSRYRVGETWDELIDVKATHLYTSQEGGPDSRANQRDYGYFASFHGPAGNHIVIVAGMRDVGLSQMAEAAASPGALGAMIRQAGRSRDFEALYEAEGLRRASLGGRLVNSSALAADRIWAPQTEPIAFPGG